jgi:hypothetical protein
MTIDMTKVFLIMRADTAAVVQRVVQERLHLLTVTEGCISADPVVVAAERAHLQTVVGQLEEPA